MTNVSGTPARATRWWQRWPRPGESGPRASAVTIRNTIAPGVNRLLHSLCPLPATDMIAYRAGELRRCYRRSHGSISLVDYLVAATAQVHGLEIVTL